MNDNELIELISDIWVKNGGDAEGLDFVYQNLKQRIREKEADEHDRT